MKKRLMLLLVLSLVFIAAVFSFTACHTHSYVGKFDAEGHWTECECGDKTDKTAHTLVVAYDAEGHWTECECGYKTDKTAHTLVVAYDAEGHWTECECGYKTDKITHTLVGDYDAEGHWTECECGYTSDKITHTLVGDYDAEGHWTECECGYKTDKIAHTLVGDYDTEGHWTECECGYKTDKITHTLVGDYDAEGHWTECECGYKTDKITHTLVVSDYDAEGHRMECECGYKTDKTAHTLVGAYDAEGHWTECECGYKTDKTPHELVEIYNVDAYHTECECGYASDDIAYDGYKRISAPYGYTAEGFTCENFAASGKALTFDYKPVGDRIEGDDDYVTFSLMSGWTRLTEYISVETVADNIASGIGTIEDIGDGWRRVTIKFSEMTNIGEGTETVDHLYFQWVNHGFLLANVDFIHVHTLVGAYDAEGHWTECECGYKTDKIAHTLVGAYDAEGHWTECECGYKTDKIAHTLVGAYDAEGHWTECECGYKTDKITHTLVVKDYDAEGHRMECDCGYITEKTAHNISNGVCSVCGYQLMVNGSTVFEAGDWDNFVAVETFNSSDKLLIFEFKPSVSSGSVDIELWNDTARVSSRIALAYDGTAPTGTTVTDIGDGWYRFEVELKQFTYASGYDNATFLKLRFRNPTADMLIANIDTTQVVVHTVTYNASSSSYTYVAGEWTTFVAVENWNGSDKVLSFEYKPSDTTKGFYIQLLNGSDTQVSEQLTITGGTLSAGHGTITDIGDGWFRYECALSEIGVKDNNGAETFSKIKFRRGNLVSGDTVMIRNLDTTH